MEYNLHKEILKDKQIKKFSMYGFLKNLKFFEPYLLIFLMDNGISLFQIGILFSIREIIINVFEIPSGFIADYLGRKKGLYICFIFYIISFMVFFLTKSFSVAVIGMIFFGLGEAFRSGTHKAMIYTFLDSKGWTSEKTFVYGKTRSVSLLGSAFSSILGILIILNVPSSGYIFLFSTIPYIIDFLLILSYPKFLDKGDIHAKTTFKQMLHSLIINVLKNSSLKKILIGDGLIESTLSAIKDFIQAILQSIIIGSSIIIISGASPKDNLNIMLGIVYALMNLLGSLSSRRAYVLKRYRPGIFWINSYYWILGIFLALIGIFINHYIIVCLLYLGLYIIKNSRKPLFVDEIECYMEKSNRATILSISSQLKSFMLIILAPIIGYLADNFGIHVTMYFLAALLIFTLPYTYLKKSL